MDLYKVHTVTINKSQGYDQFNKSIGPDIESPLKGFFEMKTRKVVTLQQEEALSTANFRTDFDESITHEDSLFYNGRRYEIMMIEHNRDFTRKNTRLYLK